MSKKQEGGIYAIAEGDEHTIFAGPYSGSDRSRRALNGTQFLQKHIIQNDGSASVIDVTLVPTGTDAQCLEPRIKFNDGIYALVGTRIAVEGMPGAFVTELCYYRVDPQSGRILIPSDLIIPPLPALDPTAFRVSNVVVVEVDPTTNTVAGTFTAITPAILESFGVPGDCEVFYDIYVSINGGPLVLDQTTTVPFFFDPAAAADGDTVCYEVVTRVVCMGDPAYTSTPSTPQACLVLV